MLCCVQLQACRLLVVGLQVFGCIDFGEQLRGEESKVSGRGIFHTVSVLLSAIVTFPEFRSRNKVNNTEWSNAKDIVWTAIPCSRLSFHT